MKNIALAPVPIESVITDVTVYLSGAQVTRVGRFVVEEGVQSLIFEGLPAHLQPESIQISGSDGVVIRSVEHAVNYLREVDQTQEIAALQQQLKDLRAQRLQEENQIELGKLEEKLFDENMHLAGTKSGLKAEELKAAIMFYNERMAAVRELRIACRARIEDLDQQIDDLENQLGGFDYMRPDPVSEITVTLVAEKNTADDAGASDAANAAGAAVAGAGSAGAGAGAAGAGAGASATGDGEAAGAFGLAAGDGEAAGDAGTGADDAGDGEAAGADDAGDGEAAAAPAEDATANAVAGVVACAVASATDSAAGADDAGDGEAAGAAYAVGAAGAGAADDAGDGEAAGAAGDAGTGATSVAAGAAEYTLTVSYFVYNASWKPFYDIRAKDINSDVALHYKAKVSQNTGENWDDVKLTLSTGNPSIHGDCPELRPWYLDFYEELKPIKQSQFQALNVSARSLGSAKIKELEDSAASEMLVTEDEAFLEKLLAPAITVSESVTSIEYNITAPYTIASGDGGQDVEITVHSLSATYRYFSVRKLEREVFLLAAISNWEHLNLVAGEASVFFENRYVGKTVIDPRRAEETFDLSLGVDSSVVVTRVRGKDFTATTLTGNNIKQTRQWELTVRNLKTVPIEIEVLDQVPVSTNKQIVVGAIEISGAEMDEGTGILTWKFTLQPAEVKSMTVKYVVSSPKNMTVLLD